jgi:hypothetical protein
MQNSLLPPVVAIHANGVSHLLSSVQSLPFPLSLFTLPYPDPNRTVTRRHGGALDASARLLPASAGAPPPSREPPPLTPASTAHAPNPHRSSTVDLGDHRARRLEVPGEPRRRRCSASHAPWRSRGSAGRPVVGSLTSSRIVGSRQSSVLGALTGSLTWSRVPRKSTR